MQRQFPCQWHSSSTNRGTSNKLWEMSKITVYLTHSATWLTAVQTGHDYTSTSHTITSEKLEQTATHVQNTVIACLEKHVKAILSIGYNESITDNYKGASLDPRSQLCIIQEVEFPYHSNALSQLLTLIRQYHYSINFTKYAVYYHFFY